jgi:glycosyltransferase involved in cell wall biosynthesis
MNVSIVIPCYNQARFVGEAIESARRQVGAEVEVIVVNDGSTDRSPAIIDAFAAIDARVRVISQPNRGLSSARNAGLDAARGTIVIFLDADDRLHPGAASAAVQSFSRHPEAMMTFGRCTLIDEQGQPMLTDLPVVERDFYAELLRRNFIWTPAMAAFRRQLFATIGRFDCSVNASADYDLYLRVARTLPIVSHDRVVADYRQHGSNMSRNPVAMLDATLAVLASQRSYIDAHPQFSKMYWEGRRAWRAFYGEHLVERFRSALHAKQYRSAWRDAGHLLRLYPRGVCYHLLKKARLMLRAGQPRYAA